MIRILVIAIVLSGFGAMLVAEEKVDFAKQVLPILQENCGKCHGEKKAVGQVAHAHGGRAEGEVGRG